MLSLKVLQKCFQPENAAVNHFRPTIGIEPANPAEHMIKGLSPGNLHAHCPPEKSANVLGAIIGLNTA